MSDQAKVDLEPMREVIDSVGEVTPDKLIPILQGIQDVYGFLPPDVLMEVSRVTRIPASRMYGVATFYEQFHLEPRGRHIIRCCRGTACHVRGGADIADAIRRHLDIDEGETTDDLRFTFETVACLGTCFLAPVIMVDNDYYGLLTPDKVTKVLDGYS